LQLISPPGRRIEYIAGLFYYDEDYDIDQDFDAGAQACIPVIYALAGATAAGICAASPQAPATASVFVQSLKSHAAFAQASLYASDKLAFTLGARYTSEDKGGGFQQNILNPVIGGLFRAAENVQGLNADDSAVTWLISAGYNATSDAMLFVTASTGFKGGGFNSEGTAIPLGAQARTFTAETSTNYEVGLKSKWLDDRLTANVTGFYTELDDFQDRSFDGLSFLTRNAGSRTQSGIEADLAFRPNSHLSLTSGVSYLDAEFKSFDGASPLPGDAVPQNLSGRRPHFAPDWQGSLIADWTGAIGVTSLEGFSRVELQYVGEQNIGGNTNQNPQSTQAAYTLFNMRIGMGRGDWRLSLYGKNLTKEGYCQVYFDQPLGEALGAVNAATNTSVQRCVLGNPRIFGASIRYEF
jgi:iron complex outermembrane receptor protein